MICVLLFVLLRIQSFPIMPLHLSPQCCPSSYASAERGRFHVIRIWKMDIDVGVDVGVGIGLHRHTRASSSDHQSSFIAAICLKYSISIRC